jgi:hypothetical protein
MKQKNETDKPLLGHNPEGGKINRAQRNTYTPALLVSQRSQKKSNPTPIKYFKDIVATIREHPVVLNKGARVQPANRRFYKFLKVKLGKTAGNLVYDPGKCR